MIVLRIENDYGVGCYATYAEDKAARAAHNFGECPLDGAFHPCPTEDDILAGQWYTIANGRHLHISGVQNRFGFASVEQFHRWFYTAESRAILTREGFAVSVYEVPDEYVAKGRAQVVYDRRYVSLIGRFPCEASVEDAVRAVDSFQGAQVGSKPALGYNPTSADRGKPPSPSLSFLLEKCAKALDPMTTKRRRRRRRKAKQANDNLPAPLAAAA